MGRIPTIYYCPYENCNASYNRKHRYETHLRSHSGERPFVCSYEDCEKAYTCVSHLRRHENTHESSFRCTVENCLSTLKTKASLNKHMRVVHLKIKKQKRYTCSQCNKDFTKRKTLQNHKVKHSGEQPHKCSVEDCQKSFLTPSKLKRHMKIHEGYPCKMPHCNKVFGKWSLYVQHTKEFHRPEHKCQVCDRLFTKSNALKSHSQIHEETRLVYPCEVTNCNRYYYDKRNLNWHMRKYHAKRPYVCDKENCYRAFKTEADLAEHILFHGKKKPRKKKPKKPKPSLAAILSGVAKVKRVNRKSKQVVTEENFQPVISSSSKVNISNLEPTKLSSANSLEPNQSIIMEENDPCVLTNEKNVSCAQSSEESTHMNNVSSNCNDDEFEEIEILCDQNIFEMDQPSIRLESNCTISMDNETNDHSTKVKTNKDDVQKYNTVEYSENLYPLISDPVIKFDSKQWKKTLAVHIESC